MPIWDSELIDSYTLTLRSDGNKPESPLHRLTQCKPDSYDTDMTAIPTIHGDITWAVWISHQLTFNSHASAGAASQSKTSTFSLQHTHAPFFLFLSSNFSYGPTRYTERRNAPAWEK